MSNVTIIEWVLMEPAMSNKIIIGWFLIETGFVFLLICLIFMTYSLARYHLFIAIRGIVMATILGLLFMTEGMTLICMVG